MESLKLLVTLSVSYMLFHISLTQEICPVGFKPIKKRLGSCELRLHGESNALVDMLKDKIQLKDGVTHHISISIVMLDNSTRQYMQNVRARDWILSYINPNGPFAYVSWRQDYSLLSFGLLNDQANRKINIQMDEMFSHCKKFTDEQEATTEIVRILTKQIREAEVLTSKFDYENIDLCYLSSFKWFKHSPWYTLKKYFGVPFQEFGYTCCDDINGTVCCNDKLKRQQGYRLAPYIISCILLCYSPILFIKIGNIFGNFHPDQWRANDNDRGKTEMGEDMISMFDNIFNLKQRYENNNYKSFLSEIRKRVWRIVFILLLPLGVYTELAIYGSSDDYKLQMKNIVTDDMLYGFSSILGDPLDTSFLSPLGGPLIALLIYHILGILIAVIPRNFENILADGICKYLDTNVEYLAPQGLKTLRGYKKVERVLKTGMYTLFNRKQWKYETDNTIQEHNNTFFFRIKRLVFLTIPLFPFLTIFVVGWFRYSVSKFSFEKCTCHHIFETLLRDKPQNSKQNDSKNSKCWDTFVKNLKELKVLDFVKGLFIFVSLGSLVMFLYISSVTVSYTISLFVYILYFICLALVSSPEKTTTYLMFTFMGIIFLYQVKRDGKEFYKCLFGLTLEVCSTETNKKYVEERDGIIYINKNIVSAVHDQVRPFYVEIGQSFFKIVVVLLGYSAVIVFLTKYSNEISIVMTNMTTVITSALYPLLFNLK